MKKLFGGGLGLGANRKRSEEEENGNTIDRLVRDKEGVRRKLEEEEKEFILKKKEHVNNLVVLEKQEIERREKELCEKKDELTEKRRLNQTVQDKYLEQMKLLEIKFEEVKEDHTRVESGMEADIAAMEDKLSQVERSLREKLSVIEPSAPPEFQTSAPLEADGDRDRDTTMYPDLNSFSRSISISRMDRSNFPPVPGSTGSSPQMSITSTISANSNDA